MDQKEFPRENCKTRKRVNPVFFNFASQREGSFTEEREMKSKMLIMTSTVPLWSV